MNTHNISKTVKNIGGLISKNSPAILTGLSVAGLLSTTIFAINATPKALKLLDSEAFERDPIMRYEDFSFTDKLKITWKLYLPAAAIGATTIACIIGANSVNAKRHAALATMYGITETAFKEYRSKVIETIGKNKELKVRDEISGDRIKKNPPGVNEIIFTGKGEILCYDSMSGRYFKGDIEQIRKSVNSLNKDLMTDMFISVNDLYYALGLAPTKLGRDMGWDLNQGLLEITFSSQLTEHDEPCLVLNYTVNPKFI